MFQGLEYLAGCGKPSFGSLFCLPQVLLGKERREHPQTLVNQC